jgi:hypothetical protein
MVAYTSGGTQLSFVYTKIHKNFIPLIFTSISDVKFMLRCIVSGETAFEILVEVPVCGWVKGTVLAYYRIR